MANILVVDDEPDVVTLIKFLLEKDGHVVQTAHNGEEALKVLGLEPPGTSVVPELIVLDVMMPIMDGYTLSTRLQENKKTRSIPLLILTAKGQTRDIFEMAPNVATYIEKPFDPKHLRDLIQGMIPSNP